MKITDPNEIQAFLVDQASVPEDGLKLTQAQAIEVLDKRTADLHRELLHPQVDVEAWMTGQPSRSWKQRVNQDIKELKSRADGDASQSGGVAVFHARLTQSHVDDVERRVESCREMAIVGIVLGLLGLTAGIIAIVMAGGAA